MQDLANQFPQHRIVLNQEDGLASTSHGFGRHLAGSGGRRGSRHSREVYPEGGATAHFADHFNPPFMLLDDPINGGQAQASSFADLFGGEEWFENSPECRSVHAAAGIGNRQADRRTHSGVCVLADIVLANFNA